MELRNNLWFYAFYVFTGAKNPEERCDLHQASWDVDCRANHEHEPKMLIYEPRYCVLYSSFQTFHGQIGFIRLIYSWNKATLLGP